MAKPLSVSTREYPNVYCALGCQVAATEAQSPTANPRQSKAIWMAGMSDEPNCTLWLTIRYQTQRIREYPVAELNAHICKIKKEEVEYLR